MKASGSGCWISNVKFQAVFAIVLIMSSISKHKAVLHATLSTENIDRIPHIVFIE